MRELRRQRASERVRTNAINGTNLSMHNQTILPSKSDVRMNDRLQSVPTAFQDVFQTLSEQTSDVMFVNPADLFSAGPVWPTTLAKPVQTLPNEGVVEHSPVGGGGDSGEEELRCALTQESAVITTRDTRNQSTRRNEILSLAERLPGRSSSSLRRVVTALRLSLESAITSGSRGSVMSWRSSWTSRHSSQPEPEESSQLTRWQDSLLTSSQTLDPIDEVRLPVGNDSCHLSEDELSMWKECMNEINIMSPRTLHSNSKYIALNHLVEGQLSSYYHKPGYNPLRYLPADPDLFEKFGKFGNTRLHVLAIYSPKVLRTIIKTLGPEYSISGKNFWGETFMHVLAVGDMDLIEYLELLEAVKVLQFPFNSQDCHGNTVAHLALKNQSLFALLRPNRFEFFGARSIQPPTTALCHMLDLFNVDLTCRNNQGEPIFSIIDANPALRLAFEWLLQVGLAGPSCGPLSVDVDVGTEVISISSIATQYQSRDLVHNKASTSMIDVHGDTALVAYLKQSKFSPERADQEEELVPVIVQLHGMGVDLNIRDKQGRTALCIAAVQGYYMCVSKLLQLGGFPNSRNYEGESVMQQVSAEIRASPTQSESKSYATIIRCMWLLLDFGGILDPTLDEEWLPPISHSLPHAL
jgi:hypothetical protein